MLDEGRTVGAMARELDGPSAHAQRDAQLRVRARASCDASQGRDGHPRVRRDLTEAGTPVRERRIARLMREDGVVARVRKRFEQTTMSDHDWPVAAAPAVWPPSWTSSRASSLAGRSVPSKDRHLTLKALQMAVKRCRPEAGLLHRSDQGCTYASEDDPVELKAHGIVCSMSRRVYCYYNAVMEAFFSTARAKSASGSRAMATPRPGCLTTSKCSITNSVGTRPQDG